MNIEEIYSLNRKLNEFEQNYIQALEENQELKKRLEEYSKVNIADHKYASKCEDKVIVLEAQQKKYIEWLEDKIKQKQKDLKDSSFAMAVVYTKAQIFTLQNALNEYKEIIGEKDE